ncbi:uncharacterized protein BO66DRAFT_437154 [Aspergillus aculeatinus CBS 121060]|uniref:Uncharacterized protein n=1 Tax=Aspergillus aculeatinus CBS 121060 TaxID=1448322 RepID=A0ACD1HDB4_9EURO|nr:hypothetical protein BO66DRAFT_437154 [Aspergillus aculeatinus CBS 121060]RAH71533.1 hypothetical protein BO66DRAFT_437154 [Aspergillus aculeatinus CBS 121060]
MEPTKSSKKAKKNKAKKNRKKANRAAAGGSGSGGGGGDGGAGTGAAESSNLSTSGQSEGSNATTALTKSVNEHELSAKGAETNKGSSNNGSSSSSSSRHEVKAPATWNKLPELASNTSRINKSDIKLSAAVAAAAAVAQSRGSRNLRVHPDTTAAASQDQGDRIHDPETAAKIVAIQAAIDRLQAIQRNPSEFVEPIEGLLRIETPPGQSCPSPLLASAKIASITVAPCRGRPGAARSEVPTKTDGEESTLAKGSGKEAGSPPPYSRDPAPTTPQNNTVTTRTGLTPIQEATAEGQQEGKAGQGDTDKSGTQEAKEGGDAHDLTPKSTSTTSTAWTASQHALQTTPQTAVTSEPSTTKTTGTQPKARGNNTTTTTQSSAKRPTLPLPPPATHPQVASSSHAHPSPPPPTTVTSTSRALLSPTASTTSTSTSTTHYQQISNVRGGTLSSQKPEGFFWQLDSHGFPCALRNCLKRCNSWDGVTVICPGCGPFSETRYCCRDHLLQGIKTHWPVCGDQVFVHPCRESTIPRDVREGPPLIPCLHNYDMPERHRQAVYFRMNERQGDYFIFADWADYVRAGFPENTTAVRCAKRVVYTVRFEDPEEKDRFRRVLAICLFATVEVHALIDYMYRLIRDQLRAANASKQLEAALRYQIHAETNVSIQQYITGERHACATDWDGRNRRNCPDQVCRSEYRRLLGSLGGGGLREVVRNMESTYWILRAARTTHPTVKDPKKRMLGEGFEGVAEEDQRVFRRGDGWDGAGTGNMEIEGMNEGPEEA